jgi:hypothetical protein
MRKALPRLLALVFAGFFLCIAAVAADRPYTQLISAVTEDDDENNFEVSSWLTTSNSNRVLSINPEYNLNPWFNVGAELSWDKDKTNRTLERAIEIESRLVFQDPARTGFGYGIAAGVEFSKQSVSQKFEHSKTTILVPMSWSMSEKIGWYHVNVGVQHVKEDKTRVFWGAAIEKKIYKSAIAFVEVAGRMKDYSLLNVGVKYWLKKDAIAIDASYALNKPETAKRHSSFAIGINVFDLSF